MVKVKREGGFDSMLTEFYSGNEEIRLLIREKIKLFKRNTNDTRLKNHALTKNLDGKWAFSITSDIRIVYEWTGKTTVRFLAIGSHKIVYKS